AAYLHVLCRYPYHYFLPRLDKRGDLKPSYNEGINSPCVMPGGLESVAEFVAKEKFCTWMYLYCDRMDAKEQ
ncbi:MAG: hypothetical protein KAI15_10610, partial [Gammaproteobacteria bacterium]|nr:hypothetical protein [Gammaproteobacteria bacterium]